MKKRKIRTESGVMIPASYKTDRYERWKDKTKVNQNEVASDDSDDDNKKGNRRKPARFGGGFPMRGVPLGMNLEGTFYLFIFILSLSSFYSLTGGFNLLLSH